MDSKLTLKLDNNIIELAKQYAKSNNISLSRLIENYLQAITTNKENKIKYGLKYFLVFLMLSRRSFNPANEYGAGFTGMRT